MTSPYAIAQDKGPELGTEFGIDYTTQYFFRGLKQAGNGLIIQPYLNVTGRVGKGVDFTVGSWNSLHEGTTGTGGGLGAWYESDFTLGFGKTFSKVRVDLTYAILHSPNDAFTVTTSEIQLNLSYDDSGMYEQSPFGGLSPHITLVFEVDGGSDLGSNLGTYLELGVEPSYQATKEISLSLPVTVGLSLDDYYEDASGVDTDLGFWSIGIAASMPLSYWTLSLGVQFLSLNESNEVLNGGDDSEVIGSVGLSLSW